MATAEELSRHFIHGEGEELEGTDKDYFLTLPVKERELTAALFLEGTDPHTLPLTKEIASRIEKALTSLALDSEVVAIARCLDVLQGSLTHAHEAP